MSDFIFSDFFQKVEFFCTELGFDEQITKRIMQILKPNLERNLEINSAKSPEFDLESKKQNEEENTNNFTNSQNKSPNLISNISANNDANNNANSPKPLNKTLNSKLQIVKIDLENNSETELENKLENTNSQENSLKNSETNSTNNLQNSLENLGKNSRNSSENSLEKSLNLEQKNEQNWQNGQTTNLSNENSNQITKAQKLEIQKIIKLEYVRITGQKLEQIETELESLKSSKKLEKLDKNTLENSQNLPESLNKNLENDLENNSKKSDFGLDSDLKLDLDFGNKNENENIDKIAILPNDMAYVRGQIVAKRALEIAASGGHNVLFLGSPGSGKTLLARAYGGILPAMTEQEILEATQIYSVAGILAKGQIIHKRPFRAPHHSASHVALVGGGSKIKPGEASLAHRGVLFLDEFPEFDRASIEALRQPLEDGFVSIARASGSLVFPSKFYLLAAANPTPSGFDPDDPDALNKPQNRAAISRYQARFSGPIMDRIDIHVEVSRPKSEELQSTVLAEKSFQIASRVQQARNIQTQRFANYYKNKPNLPKIQSNSEMNLPMIQEFCVLDANSQKLLSSAIERFKLSARAYMRILKLSRTIADLAQSQNIQTFHLAESLQYRGRWS